MDTLILMAKAPIPGTVKTRLCPPLSPGEAARVYDRLLRGTAARLRAVRAARRLWIAPAGSEGRFRGPAFRGYAVAAQRGRDLGERMTHAIGAAFAEGARRVVVVGADCPALSARRVALAFRELRAGADVVLGPAPDGGFYLAGFAALPSALLGKGIAWSTGTVLASVAARCREAGLSWSMLPVERDVDTPADLAWFSARWPARARAAAAPGTSRSAGRR